MRGSSDQNIFVESNALTSRFDPPRSGMKFGNEVSRHGNHDLSIDPPRYFSWGKFATAAFTTRGLNVTASADSAILRVTRCGKKRIDRNHGVCLLFFVEYRNSQSW